MPPYRWCLSGTPRWREFVAVRSGLLTAAAYAHGVECGWTDALLGAAAPRAARHDTADCAELHREPRQCAVPSATLVTLECTPVDIAMSVIGEAGGVYSPRVLRLWGQGQSEFSLPLRGRTT